MNIVERVQLAIRALERLGWSIRQEWLDGEGSGKCVLRGKKILFLDLSQDINEHFELLFETLRGDSSIDLLDPTLLGALDKEVRKSA